MSYLHVFGSLMTGRHSEFTILVQRKPQANLVDVEVQARIAWPEVFPPAPLCHFQWVVFWGRDFPLMRFQFFHSWGFEIMHFEHQAIVSQLPGAFGYQKSMGVRQGYLIVTRSFHILPKAKGCESCSHKFVLIWLYNYYIIYFDLAVFVWIFLAVRRCDPAHQRNLDGAGSPQDAEALCSADPSCGGADLLHCASTFVVPSWKGQLHVFTV